MFGFNFNRYVAARIIKLNERNVFIIGKSFFLLFYNNPIKLSNGQVENIMENCASHFCFKFCGKAPVPLTSCSMI